MNNDHVKVVASFSTIGLLMGVICWITLLIKASQHISGVNNNISQTTFLGTMPLFTISKQASEHGSIASISLGVGTLWFMILSIIIGVVIGYGLTILRQYKK
jgi:ABC-type phosphate transport system permease subunit